MDAEKDDKRRLGALEMECHGRLLGLLWFHFVTNEDITKTIVKRRKVRRFVHVCRMMEDRLLKLTVIRVIDETNIRGRRRTLIDDINECTGMSTRHLTEIAHDHKQWFSMAFNGVPTASVVDRAL